VGPQGFDVVDAALPAASNPSAANDTAPPVAAQGGEARLLPSRHGVETSGVARLVPRGVEHNQSVAEATLLRMIPAQDIKFLA
jgi:hypothetical protein